MGGKGEEGNNRKERRRADRRREVKTGKGTEGEQK